ncbi:hypothetical protein FB451DRAFT_137664, partial [Mycena latifolia]
MTSGQDTARVKAERAASPPLHFPPYQPHYQQQYQLPQQHQFHFQLDTPPPSRDISVPPQLTPPAFRFPSTGTLSPPTATTSAITPRAGGMPWPAGAPAYTLPPFSVAGDYDDDDPDNDDPDLDADPDDDDPAPLPRRASNGKAGKEKPVRRRSSKACDQCRKSKCKCEPADTPSSAKGGKSACRACVLLGTPCTFLGPSRKRGPPKGYIDAIEARLHQTEALVGILLSAAGDRRAQGVLRDLREDPLARAILARIEQSAYGPAGRASSAAASTSASHSRDANARGTTAPRPPRTTPRPPRRACRAAAAGWGREGRSGARTRHTSGWTASPRTCCAARARRPPLPLRLCIIIRCRLWEVGSSIRLCGGSSRGGGRGGSSTRPYGGTSTRGGTSSTRLCGGASIPHGGCTRRRTRTTRPTSTRSSTSSARIITPAITRITTQGTRSRGAPRSTPRSRGTAARCPRGRCRPGARWGGDSGGGWTGRRARG